MAAQDERDLRAVLRAEADRHEPDRAAMLRRINQARSAAPGGVLGRIAQVLRRPLSAVRPMAAAAAVTAVLVLAVAGINLAGHSRRAPSTPLAAPSSAPAASPTEPTPPPSPTGTTGSPTGHPNPSHRVTSLGPPAATSATPSAAQDGYLTVVPALDQHSVDTWAQSNLTVTITEPVTALQVTIKVARTAGVAKTGHWSSASDTLIEQTVHTADDSLLYAFTLTKGSTLAAGTYVFAAQYSHASGTRSLAGDGWTAEGTAQAGPAKLSGGFN